ncbi:MAG: hypothetical protein HY560_09230, partial [Gemmatimonadetes bacterium]|nr:hypothetical protein [Gemmatimonadota bacterium]
MRAVDWEGHHAQLALSVLLGESAFPPRFADWEVLARLAAQNAVLVRLAERLHVLDVHPPPSFATTVERERERAGTALAVLRQVRTSCARHGIEWLVPKAAQR